MKTDIENNDSQADNKKGCIAILLFFAVTVLVLVLLKLFVL
ncbi:MAG: hypothetical protein U0W24_12015 [Bacteroidales bacterium]